MAGDSVASFLRTCTRCGETKPLEEYHRDSRLPSGRRPHCAECGRRARRKQGDEARRKAGVPRLGGEASCAACRGSFTLTNPRQKYCPPCGRAVKKEKARQASRRRPRPSKEKQREYWTRYVEKNRQKVRERALTYSKRPEAKLRAAERAKEKRLSASVRIHGRMSAGIRAALRTGKAGRGWEAIAGYTLADLMDHLERRFKPGMSWENISEWEIDHIMPRRAFVFENETDPEFKACWSLTNLQPLWKRENRVKSGKIPKEEQRWQLLSNG